MTTKPIRGPISLRQLIEQRPDWADLPITVLNSCGELGYVGCSALIYKGEDYSDPNLDVRDPVNVATPVLVISPN